MNPKFTMYHPNAKGTGCAMRLDLQPAHDDIEGGIFLMLARQTSTVSNPTFDWESAITVKLNFDDLTKMLQVFRGETEIIAEGRGLFHGCKDDFTIIKLVHTIDYVTGYTITVIRHDRNSESEETVFFTMSCAEALGVSVVIENSLGVICFGVPEVVRH